MFASVSASTLSDEPVAVERILRHLGERRAVLFIADARARRAIMRSVLVSPTALGEARDNVDRCNPTKGASMKNLILVLAGAVGGVAFLLTCSSSGHRTTAGRDATAAPSDCAAWQIAELVRFNVNFPDETAGRLPRAPDADVFGGPVAVWDLPAGWEPIALSSTVVARRCKP
jgi:hypothetical protein